MHFIAFYAWVKGIKLKLAITDRLRSLLWDKALRAVDMPPKITKQKTMATPTREDSLDNNGLNIIQVSPTRPSTAVFTAPDPPQPSAAKHHSKKVKKTKHLDPQKKKSRKEQKPQSHRGMPPRLPSPPTASSVPGGALTLPRISPSELAPGSMPNALVSEGELVEPSPPGMAEQAIIPASPGHLETVISIPAETGIDQTRYRRDRFRSPRTEWDRSSEYSYNRRRECSEWDYYRPPRYEYESHRYQDYHAAPYRRMPPSPPWHGQRTDPAPYRRIPPLTSRHECPGKLPIDQLIRQRYECGPRAQTNLQKDKHQQVSVLCYASTVNSLIAE